MKSGISPFLTVVMSIADILSFGKFSFSAFMAAGLISDVNTHFPESPLSSRACSNPILIPPSPANRSINMDNKPTLLVAKYCLTIFYVNLQ